MPIPSGTHFPIQVISTIKPVNNASFPVVSDVDIEGGYQVRTSLSDRDNIPTENRKEGMLVFVQSDGYFYTLSGGITNSNWIIRDFGGGGGTLAGDVTGDASANTVVKINGISIDTGTSPTIGGALHYVQDLDTSLFPPLPQPQLRYFPASCTNLNRPLNPFVGQMVFVTDLNSPNPSPVWWNGTGWVDANGNTR